MITIFIDTQELRYTKSMAKAAEIGGNSNIRERGDRMAKIGIDQWIGQIGQYALSLYMFGSPDKYYQQRMISNMHPTVGDNGQDILGSNIDVKTSLMRYGLDPYKYRLAVRPKERHDGHIYILALVEPNVDKALSLIVPLKVYLVGYAVDNELSTEPDSDGPFSGAFTVMSDMLHPMMPIQWHWRKYDSLHSTGSML